MSTRVRNARPKRILKVVTATGITAAMLAITAPGAIADERARDATEATAALIEQVAPSQGKVLEPTHADGAATAHVDDVTVTVPVDPDESISLHSSDSTSATADLPALKMSLPAEVHVSDSTIARDGTIVFEATDGGTSSAVQILADGSTRVQTVTPDASGVHAFTYRFHEGVVPELLEDGSVALVVPGDGTDQQIGAISTPWAVDATGAPVTTRYEVADNTVVQHIEPTESTIYPVVADPLLTFGVSVYLNLTGAQWKAVMLATTGAVVGVTSAACMGRKVPGRLSRIFSRACDIIGVPEGITAFMNSFEPIKNMKLSARGCYQVKLAPRGPLTKVHGRNCR